MGRGLLLGGAVWMLACGDAGDADPGSTGPAPGTSGGTTATSEGDTGDTGDTPTTDAPTTAPTTDAPTTTSTTDAPTTSPGDTTDTTDTGDTGGADLEIGAWVDEPGVCPPGTVQVDLDSVAQLEAASRGEQPHDQDGPGTCYFIHDGEYPQGDALLLYMQHGGTADQPIYWIGESRDGVRIVGRATFDPGASHIVMHNLTFDLSGYDDPDPFNTIDIGEVQDITLSHLTLTGDCATGLKGGHIETNGVDGLRVEACLIENYGHCGPDGHEDHGVYLAGGKHLSFVNNVIRGNASRGIQMYTQNGDYGTLDAVVIERNRIHENGHGDHEDGIVINAKKLGTISDVQIRHNLIYRNYFSGVRFAGPATADIVIEHNTFAANGIGSDAANRSEINIDEPGLAANASITGNIFAVDLAAINDCGGAESMGFSLANNVILGTVATGDDACVSATIAIDPQFVDPAAADFHPQNPAAADHGAYAP